jgi:chromosome segregation ATPase
MNDLQRQLLADRIDAVERELDLELYRLDRLEKQVARKDALVRSLQAQLAKLKEGVDW